VFIARVIFGKCPRKRLVSEQGEDLSGARFAKVGEYRGPPLRKG
jgi:hypothetical protein